MSAESGRCARSCAKLSADCSSTSRVRYDKADIRDAVTALASYVALARSPVDRDQRSEIRLVLDPEAPTRIIKMLAQSGAPPA